MGWPTNRMANAMKDRNDLGSLFAEPFRQTLGSQVSTLQSPCAGNVGALTQQS